MIAKKLSVCLLFGAMALFAGQAAIAELVVYTTDAQFDQGTLTDVNHDAPNMNQLQLNLTETPFAFVNVAASGRGTIVRINADTGGIMGEYRTAPKGAAGDFTPYPSRTSTDSLGNVWTANRDVVGGSVVKLGIVVGGTRVSVIVNENDETEVIEDPNGDYLAPPYDYNSCIDRDNDGLIRTSRRLGDILSWSGNSAEDECILIYQELDFEGAATHVSVDAANDVWVGEYPPGMFYKLNGETGAELTSFNAGSIGCGGWGGLVDANGVLWSASPGENTLLHYNPATGIGGCTQLEELPWGLGIDSNGFIWNSLWGSDEIAKVDPMDFSIVDGFPNGNPPFTAPEGVAVSPVDNNIWVANGGGSEVLRLNNDGVFLSEIEVGQTPTGVAVDVNGKVWVTNLGDNNVMRIDPAGNGGLGAVDLTVALGDVAEPDNYSNMTGVAPISSIAIEGTWTVINDSGIPGQSWDTIIWNTEPEASEPEESSISVEARAADTQAGLTEEVYIPISNNVPFSLTGQFIEIRVTLQANDEGESPVLSDLAVDVKTAPERAVCDVDENGIIDFRDIKGIIHSFGDTADGSDDPRDWDGDGIITKIDAKGCFQACTDPQCGFPELEKYYKLKKRWRSKTYWGSEKHWRSMRYWKITNRWYPAQYGGDH
jgi:streptogramin lyase